MQVRRQTAIGEVDAPAIEALAAAIEALAAGRDGDDHSRITVFGDAD
jgi:hypothetical protein